MADEQPPPQRPARPLVGYRDVGEDVRHSRGAIDPCLDHPRRARRRLPRLDADGLLPRARPALSGRAVYVKHLTSLQFLTYLAFFAVLVAAMFRFVPGRAPPARDEPYSEEELGAHDRKAAKYFVAGGFFLVLGSLHMVLKNLPWPRSTSRARLRGHLVRDLSNTHVMIVGGGTLLATGLCWLVLPRIVGRPLASDGLAQCAFWFTVVGLASSTSR